MQSGYNIKSTNAVDNNIWKLALLDLQHPVSLIMHFIVWKVNRISF